MWRVAGITLFRHTIKAIGTIYFQFVNAVIEVGN